LCSYITMCLTACEELDINYTMPSTSGLPIKVVQT